MLYPNSDVNDILRHNARSRSSWDTGINLTAFVDIVEAELDAMAKTKRGCRGATGIERQRVITSIWHVCITGMQWRQIADLMQLPLSTVFSTFQRWTRQGLWGRILPKLVMNWRISAGDTRIPSALVIDSASRKSTPTSGWHGIDGGKRVKGAKLHMAVDKHGLPYSIHISEANEHDITGALAIIEDLSDRGYQGSLLGDLGYRGRRLHDAGEAAGIEVVTRAGGINGTFIPTGIRWVVERSFAWLNRYRRLNSIYERTEQSLTAFVQIAFISMLAKRFAMLETEGFCGV